MADLVDSDGWVPLLDTTDDGPVTSDVATQTEGIFYPSSRSISKAMAATEAVLTSWTVKKPQGGMYSPGRGKAFHSQSYFYLYHTLQQAIGVNNLIIFACI